MIWFFTSETSKVKMRRCLSDVVEEKVKRKQGKVRAKHKPRMALYIRDKRRKLSGTYSRGRRTTRICLLCEEDSATTSHHVHASRQTYVSSWFLATRLWLLLLCSWIWRLLGGASRGRSSIAAAWRSRAL